MGQDPPRAAFPAYFWAFLPPPPFSIACHGFWARSAGAGPARGALHNVRTTSHTTWPQRHTQRGHNVIHNVATTSTQRSRGRSGLIPQERWDFEGAADGPGLPRAAFPAYFWAVLPPPPFSIALPWLLGALGRRGACAQGPTQRAHNVIHNVATTSYTTWPQRGHNVIHNVRTTSTQRSRG